MEDYMERKLTYDISADCKDLAISDYLKWQGFSTQNLIELKKMKESVLVNGIWEHLSYKLQPGDRLLIHIQENSSNDKIHPVPLSFPIIYEDEDIVVVNKPSDMPIHPSQNNFENTLANAAAYYYEVQQNTPFTFRCVNRLDRDTTGLTILAKNMYAASLLSSQMQKRQIKRIYLALADGYLPQRYGTIRLSIGRKEGSTIERQIDREQGESAVTHYYRLAGSTSFSLVALCLETGRTHQIRVHMTSLGHPLLGDTLYNKTASASALPRQALHAYRISFIHPVTKEKMKLIAPVPEDMLAIIKSVDAISDSYNCQNYVDTEYDITQSKI